MKEKKEKKRKRQTRADVSTYSELISVSYLHNFSYPSDTSFHFCSIHDKEFKDLNSNTYLTKYSIKICYWMFIWHFHCF